MSAFRLGRHHADTVYLQFGPEPSDTDERVAIFLRGGSPGCDAEAPYDAQRYVDLMNGTPTASLVPPSFLDILEAITDKAPCWFDNDGGCQAHGELPLGPGEKCPQRQAQEILKESGR